MRVLTIVTLAAGLALSSGTAVAKDKPEAPKAKKVCVVIEPAVGRLPAKRICRVEAQPVAESANAQSGASKPAAAGDAAASHN